MPHKLSVYLVKKEFKKIEEIIKKDGAKNFSINLTGNRRGRLFFKSTFTEEPKWFDIFKHNISGLRRDSLKTKSISAAFLLKVKGRFFVFTFGYGSRSLLNLEAIEERFGLKVCLKGTSKNSFYRAPDVSPG